MSVISSQKERFATQKVLRPKLAVSAFDEKGYELTELGKQFVHYAMSDLPLKIEFKTDM
jgi:hypothetical protein